MRFAIALDLGLVRKNNEDSIFARDTAVGRLDNLFMVADGMGGHLGGEYASQFVVRKIPELLEKKADFRSIRNLLLTVTDRANKALYQISVDREDLRGMGTTLVLATVKHKTVHIINVGDSRLYTYDGGLTQITRDHSLVEEMVAAGRLNRSDPLYDANKNIITRAMGIDPCLEQDYFSLEAKPGMKLLLCSDGLCGQVKDAEIAAVLAEEPDLEKAAARLVELSKAHGGSDNISVIIVELGDTGAAADGGERGSVC